MSSYVSDADTDAGCSACPSRRRRSGSVAPEREVARSGREKRRGRRPTGPHKPPDEPPAETGATDVPAEEVEEVPKGTAEEALTREHQMTHVPRNPFCETCAKAKLQRKQKRNMVAQLAPGEAAKKAPAKFGEQVTGCHFIKNTSLSGDEEDPNLPIDTVAVVLYDRGTTWLAVYPKATKTAYHTVEAMQHFCGPKGSYS